MSNSENKPASPSCLLCGHAAVREVWRLDGRAVRRLLSEKNHALSEAAFGALRPETPVELFGCRSCGFRFFDPAFAGSAKFYEELEQSDYYVKHRPEFDFALRLCRRTGARKILDVGGGEGAFLDHAKTAGLRTFGVELNERAAKISAGKGHTIIQKQLEAISPAELDGGVDALTLFQVVEHVPDPRAFLTAAARLVRPGGLLIVSVPNDRGVFRLFPWDPLNLPPHHVSRWRRADLKRLGGACGLRWFAGGADVLYGSGIEQFLIAHNHLARAVGRPARFGGEWFPKMISFLYRKLGCRHYGPRWGLSIYAAYQKPDSP